MKKEKANKIFNRFIEATDQTFVQANEFSVIFYFYIAFSYILLFTSPTLFFQSIELRISTEIIHGLVTVSFLLCTIVKYIKKPLYWINTLVLILRYVGLFDVSAQWHDVFNVLFIGVLTLYYFIVIAVSFAKRINEEGGPFDTVLLAVGVFFILLWALFNFEYKWMFVIGGGCCYLYALARVFKNVFYGKNNKELRLIQIIGNIMFYVTIIVGLPFFLEYAGVNSTTIQNTVVPIYAATIGGIMTLGGVAWTIKKSDKDRKEENRGKARPFFGIIDTDNYKSEVSQRLGIGFRPKEFNKLNYYKEINIENSDKVPFFIEKFVIGEREYYPDSTLLISKGMMCALVIYEEDDKKTNINKFYLYLTDINYEQRKYEIEDLGSYRYTIKEI